MSTINNPLAAKAVITTLNVGCWRTRKLHAGETKAENARHGLTNEARVDIQICEHPSLQAIADLHSEARLEHYRLTLPSSDDGLRLLPGARQFEHSDRMREFADRIEAHKVAFLRDYPALAASAPAKLKGLYEAKHWPTVDAVRAKFYFRTRYLPVPTSNQWSAWVEEAATEATAALKERFAEAVRRMAQSLSDPKKRFHGTLVTNVTDLLAIAPDLNLADDPEIARLVAQAKSLVEFDADTLREDPIARANVAEKAAGICSMFNL